MKHRQSPRTVSLASAPKFILVGYALLNNKILVRSGPFRVLTKAAQSYGGAKIAFSFFLSIYSRGCAPASWAARHTTVCLDHALSIEEKDESLVQQCLPETYNFEHERLTSIIPAYN